MRSLTPLKEQTRPPLRHLTWFFPSATHHEHFPLLPQTSNTKRWKSKTTKLTLVLFSWHRGPLPPHPMPGLVPHTRAKGPTGPATATKIIERRPLQDRVSLLLKIFSYLTMLRRSHTSRLLIFKKPENKKDDVLVKTQKLCQGTLNHELWWGPAPEDHGCHI